MRAPSPAPVILTTNTSSLSGSAWLLPAGFPELVFPPLHLLRPSASPLRPQTAAGLHRGPSATRQRERGRGLRSSDKLFALGGPPRSSGSSPTPQTPPGSGRCLRTAAGPGRALLASPQPAVGRGGCQVPPPPEPLRGEAGRDRPIRGWHPAGGAGQRIEWQLAR